MNEPDDIMAKIAELEAQLSSLKQLVDQRPTAAMPTAPPDGSSPVDDESPSTSRRRWLAGAGAAAAGVVVAATSSSQVAAADPDDVVKGADNVTAARTTITGGDFRVRDTGATSLVGFTAKVEGVAASTTYNGVLGSARRPNGYGMIAMADRAAGARSQLLIEPNGPPPPTGTGNRPGEIAADEDNDLWYAISNTVSRKLAGPTTAGSLHPITPVRVFDSRLAPIPQSGMLMGATNRTISVKDGYDFDGAVSDADVVPAGATAVVCNLTVTGGTASNFVAVVPGSATGFATSSINYTAGQTIANGLTVGLDDDRQIKLFAGDTPGGTHVIIDVSAYYL